MTTYQSPAYLVSLVHELRKIPKETEWLEFKHNKADPQDVGEYISALANSATRCGKATGYMVWGISDGDQAIVGTVFDPSITKVGNEELESWLLRLLNPKIHFRFHPVEVDGKTLIVLEIERAFRHPVQFQNQEYIRIGSYKKKLKEFPEIERELWRIFDKTPFEIGIAREQVSSDEVLHLLDYPGYFDMLRRPLPGAKSGILEALEQDSLINANAGHWNVTNMGALLFSKNLRDFRGVGRKALRLVRYRGESRVHTIREHEVHKGYAVGFEGAIAQLRSLLPSHEELGSALRKEVTPYPELAIRELVANALIHQDLFITGSGPLVEIFEHRLEITNPGAPLVSTDRFLDSPPRSRNEALASFMRRLGICEERGSGVDKIVSSTETQHLPAPLFEVYQEATRTVLFTHQPLAKMSRDDRVRACYLHACLRYVNRDYLSNGSLRERFGIDARNSATASRLIGETMQAGMIRPFDEFSAKKQMKYLPYWA